MNNRRRFLTQSAATGIFYIAKTSWAEKSPGDTVNVAVVGFGGRGGSHISGYREQAKEGVRVAALCDVDQKVLDKGVAGFKSEKLQPAPYTDIRKLLENKDIDAISIATPNHWHSLAAIWGMQAGKDVYVEKPVSHNVWEGRQAVNAARKYNKIVQTGTQSRSSRTGIYEAVKWVEAGNLGAIKLVRGLCYKRRASIGKFDSPESNPADPSNKKSTKGEAGVPSTVDYNLWCGPAPMDEPLHRMRLHYDWHWFWNYGNGDLGNQGIHQMDIARWFLGEMELSPRVWSVGGRLGYVDDGETANTQILYHDYEKAPLIFEVRGLPASKGSNDMDKLKGAGVGVIVECEGGYIVVPSYTGSIAYDKDGKEIKSWKEPKGAETHFKNFINACRSRRREDLHAEILEGHLSSALCHTGNISYRLGKKEQPDAILEKIKGDKFAAESFGRMREHLAKNEVDVTKDLLTIGPALKFDPKTERFVDNDEANALVKDKYREPFVVPEIAA